MQTKNSEKKGRRKEKGLGDDVLKLLKSVYRRALKSLPLYSSKYSKKTFSQPQMAACVFLKDYFELDLRGLEELISSEPLLRETLGFETVPDHTTLSRHLNRRSEDFRLQPIGTGTPSFIISSKPPAGDGFLGQM